MKYGPKASKFKSGEVWHVKLKNGIAEEITVLSKGPEGKAAAERLVKKLNKQWRKST